MTQRPPPSTVLVTGGCGFIGRQLCLRLLALGHNVLVVDDLSYGMHPDIWLKDALFERRQEGGRLHYRLGPSTPDTQVTLTLIQEDVVRFCGRKEPPFAREAYGWPIHCAAVFHLASSENDPTRRQRPMMLEAAKVATDGQFFAWAHAHQQMIERLVYVSPKDVYGDDTSFERAAHAGEDLARQMAQNRKTSVAVVRLATVYGKDQPEGNMMAHLAQEVVRATTEIHVPPALCFPKDFLHVDDAVTGLLAASVQPFDNEPITLGTATLTTPSEVLAMMARVQQRPLRVHGPKPQEDGRLLPYVAKAQEAQKVLGFRAKVALTTALPQVLRTAERREATRLTAGAAQAN